MHEIRNFVVAQTREVSVRANSLEDAIRIAGRAFVDGQNSDGGVKLRSRPEKADPIEGIWGNTTSRIKETDLSAREAY